MEHYIKQNNVFNIYEDYFTDAVDVCVEQKKKIF